MKMLALVSLLICSTAAHAKSNLNSMKIGDSAGIKNSAVYTFVGDASNSSIKEKAEAVGKQIRRQIYQHRFLVENYSYSVVSYKKAAKLLSTSEGDFTALKPRDFDAIDNWIEDKKVQSIVQMDIELSQHGGTALEQNFIFIPTEDYDPILVVNRAYFTE